MAITSSETERTITSVDIDCHRWYCIVTTTYDVGEPDARVIGTQMGDGLGVYDSVAEWERINT